MSGRKFAARVDRAGNALLAMTTELRHTTSTVARGAASPTAGDWISNLQQRIQGTADRRVELAAEYERVRQLVVTGAVPTQADEVAVARIERTANDLANVLAFVRGVGP